MFAANAKPSREDFLDLFEPEVEMLIDVVSAQVQSLRRDPQNFYMLVNYCDALLIVLYVV